ncbi:MAG: hypothetical protein EXQ56_01330 [Acidobacteria bacterium]|nr:hypothetical protein [Acidobacteriota bacterium]
MAKDSVKWVLGSIVKIIQAKKHIKNHPYEVAVKGNNNNVVIINGEGNNLEFPHELVPLLRTKKLDSELHKIAKPLAQGRIDSVELRSGDLTESIEASISVGEREYFSVEEVATIITKESTLDGFLESINKETRRGTFHLRNGRGIPYHYKGENPTSFFLDFGYAGLVRVSCMASFDSDLQPIKLDIFSVDKLQRPMLYEPLDED